MSDLNSDVNKTKMKPSNIEEDAVYTKEMRRKDTIEKLERDYNGIFTEPEKMEKEFPKFYKWLKSIVYFDNVKDNVLFFEKDKGRYSVYLFTNKYQYSIFLKKPNDNYYGYCGAMLEQRKTNVGETWHRGRDLSDGIYCEETFNRIEKDIIKNELQPLEVFKDC